MTMHPAIRAACRTLAQAGIGFTVVSTPPWEERETPEGCDRVAERRRVTRHRENDRQLDFGFRRPAYSHKPPGQRSETPREYAAEYA